MSGAKTRNDLLADLADDVRELTEPRHHTEMVEAVERDGAKRRRVRRPHPVTMPSLLQCLLDCLTPASSGDMAAVVASFESKPSADLEPLRVFRAIEDGADHWCAMLSIEASTVTARLSRLVGAHHTDQQLSEIARDVHRWVRDARIATGWDAPSFTLGDACPNCGRRNTLVVSGDLDHAKCGRCRMEWPHDLIGILSQMLIANQTEEVVRAGGMCGAPLADETCYLVPDHQDLHVTPRGRCWPRTEQDIA
jgi:hypothetical protein